MKSPERRAPEDTRPPSGDMVIGEPDYPAAADLSPAPEVFVEDGEVVARYVDSQPTREPIDSAPQDGRDVMVYYGPGDETGRVARWHAGRRFNGRRWVIGGHWVPSDSPTPLPADEPTEWLRFPRDNPSQSDEPEPAAA